jgi:hypothetical protein
MLVAAMNAAWDLDAVLRRFIAGAELCTLALPRVKLSITRRLAMARAALEAQRPYDVITNGLAAWSSILSLTGPDREARTGPIFCHYLRHFYPQPPPGFERVGRTQNQCLPDP